MRRIQTSKRTLGSARRERYDELLPLDPRDPDIVRVKRQQRQTETPTTHTVHGTP